MKTDKDLQQDVIDELDWDPTIEAERIGVEVHDGVVTLAGHVTSYAQKWRAEEAAQRVQGVKGVIAELKVEIPGIDKRPDEELVRAARLALIWNASVPVDAVKVLVENGWLTLSGGVEWAYQKQSAETAVRDLVGIKGVVNLIELKPRVMPENVAKQIEAALQRRAHYDAKAISIKVADGTVTLSGKLDSNSERDAVRRAAWEAPGIHNVIDRMTLNG
ncbi:MAG TPA: BON domain-containing protein [Rhodanobacteraceae bacterium]|nr:BON domain-containing protein [Rhodanobacteraceae bacterium]